MIDILQVPGFVDDAARDEIVAELRAAAGAAATVLSPDAQGTVMATVRRTTRVAAPPAVRERLSSLFEAARPRLEAHFGMPLGAFESPQFLRYETGDFFVPHQDGNTPLVYDDSRFRRISVVLFMSTPSDAEAPETYGGGELVFHGPYTGPPERVPVQPPAGTLVAFRAETTHEVTPVTHGERFTIVTWFRAADGA